MPLEKKFFPYNHYEFVHPISGDCLRINPERGGLITGWKCGNREVLYFDLERFADHTKSIRGGIPVLFPICGNIFGNTFSFKGENYILNQHGFARDMPWKIQLLENDTGVRMVLKNNEMTLDLYPFSFEIQMTIKLQKNALEICVEISNNSDYKMPFSFGLHPYFNVSSLSNIIFTGLPERCLNQKNMMDSLVVDQVSMLSSGIDVICQPSSQVTLTDTVSKEQLHLICDSPMNMIVIWTDPPRNMICVEPWTSPRNSLVSGDRRIELEPAGNQNFRCIFQVS